MKKTVYLACIATCGLCVESSFGLNNWAIRHGLVPAAPAAPVVQQPVSQLNPDECSLIMNNLDQFEDLGDDIVSKIFGEENLTSQELSRVREKLRSNSSVAAAAAAAAAAPVRPVPIPQSTSAIAQEKNEIAVLKAELKAENATLRTTIAELKRQLEEKRNTNVPIAAKVPVKQLSEAQIERLTIARDRGERAGLTDEEYTNLLLGDANQQTIEKAVRFLSTQPAPIQQLTNDQLRALKDIINKNDRHPENVGFTRNEYKKFFSKEATEASIRKALTLIDAFGLPKKAASAKQSRVEKPTVIPPVVKVENMRLPAIPPVVQIGRVRLSDTEASVASPASRPQLNSEEQTCSESSAPTKEKTVVRTSKPKQASKRKGSTAEDFLGNGVDADNEFPKKKRPHGCKPQLSPENKRATPRTPVMPSVPPAPLAPVMIPAPQPSVGSAPLSLPDEIKNGGIKLKPRKQQEESKPKAPNARPPELVEMLFDKISKRRPSLEDSQIEGDNDEFSDE